jgi:pyruvate-formate lyase-activating enzyme
MKLNKIVKFTVFGLSTVLFKRKKAILGTIIVTDKCNLTCKHCAVNNVTSIIYPYEQIQKEMKMLYEQGIRILFFCGGETFLWKDSDKTIRDLVIEAKQTGFDIVNVVTNGTFPIDLPEADIILLSIDGNEKHHNEIRGDTYSLIMENVKNATARNIIIYTAINKINQNDIQEVSNTARDEKNIKAISFNFHTPYKGTEELCLTTEEKQKCCDIIAGLIDNQYPVFNLKSAFRYIVNNSFKTPCHQCVVVENGKEYVCGRCVNEQGLCKQCGYFFAAEYSLIFEGNIKVINEMLKVYLRYI